MGSISLVMIARVFAHAIAARLPVVDSMTMGNVGIHSPQSFRMVAALSADSALSGS
jgi:hypothetical protein